MKVLGPESKEVRESKEGDCTVVETKNHTFKIYEGSDNIDTYQAGRPLAIAESIDSLALMNRRTLFEAATTSEFPSQLREDFRVIMLSAFQAVTDVLQPLLFNINSTKETETYAGIEKLKPTPGTIIQNSPYFTLGTTAKADVVIRNEKHGGIVEVTEEIIRYDKSGEITRLATELGESVKYERYELIRDHLVTAANTTAQSSTLTLTPTNLESMITTYQTQTDTASSKILNWNPDTLIVPAALQWKARRILESAGVSGSADNDTNVLRNIVRLVICPLLDSDSTTRFYLGRQRNANGLIYQNVIGPTPETFTQQATKQFISDDVFFFDLVRYKARLIYGIGTIDNRIWHRSTT